MVWLAAESARFKVPGLMRPGRLLGLLPNTEGEVSLVGDIYSLIELRPNERGPSSLIYVLRFAGEADISSVSLASISCISGG